MHTFGGRRAARCGAHQCRSACLSCRPRSRAAADRWPPVVCTQASEPVTGPLPVRATSMVSSPRPAVTAAIPPERTRDGAGESAHPGG
jgi:hypothetical protein